MTGILRSPADPAADAAAATAKTLSRLRGKRIFHPHGVGFAAALTPIGERLGASALSRPVEATVRLSRALGLPEPVPDLFGLAFRVADAYGPGLHQDLLLATTGSSRLGRHALLPGRGFCDRTYSSLLPYRLEDELLVLGARALGCERPGPGLAELRRRESASLEFELLAAAPGGSWRPVARLALGDRVPPAETERLDLDPTNTGGGLELAGWLNRLRGPTYRASQAGRGARA